jgi:hypothetical protein
VPSESIGWLTVWLFAHVREAAGTQRYNVGTDTPKLCATSCGGVPLTNSFLAAWILLSVIRRFFLEVKAIDQTGILSDIGTRDQQGF